ncbi:hypothetical protein FH972_025611 [Carpinus fangiana]|uniref:Uncharacterized protein n=1 Tax=Carpinus fangiana TaxID=176857 RepID=A0A5N6L1H7_9ROSI|nr:hypothetical protein FH972_025611 [Carpinus fangiana]
MANSRKTYFLTPTRTHPPNRRIVLGSIIELAQWPEETLLNDKILPIPPSSGPYKHSARNYKSTVTKSGEFNPGIFADFLQQILGLGATLGIGFKRSDTEELTAKSLDTLTFEPSQEYIDEAMKADRVAAKVKEKRIWERSGRVFMITGIKIARGAAVTTKKNKSTSAQGEFSLSLAIITAGMAPVPLTFGPKADIKNSNDQSVSFSASDDFVYAYRLSKITVKDGKAKAEPHYKGTVLDDSESDEEITELEYTTEDWSIEADFSGAAHQMLDETGEEVFVAKVKDT